MKQLSTGILVVLFSSSTFISGNNLALNKKCFQSSTLGSNKADLATDGDRGCQFKGCASTEKEADSWWVVDLDFPYYITEVLIFGTAFSTNNADSLENFYVEVISHNRNDYDAITNMSTFFEFAYIQESHFQQGLTNYLNVSCKEAHAGNFLRIRRTDQNSLKLCEVEVYGTPFARGTKSSMVGSWLVYLLLFFIGGQLTYK